MAIDFEPVAEEQTIDFEAIDFEPVDDAQELGARASGQVASISQQKPQDRDILGEIRGGWTKGSRNTIASNIDIQGAAALGTKMYPEGAQLGGTGVLGGLPLGDEQTLESDLLSQYEEADSYDARRAILVADKQRDINEAFGGASQDTWLAKGAEIVASIVKDPFSLAFPAGKGKLAAGLVAGGTGATTETVQQITDKGEVDAEQVAVVAALSAAGGVAVEAVAVPIVQKAVDKFRNKGRPLDAAKLTEEFKNSGVSYGDADLNKLASELNTSYNLHDITPKSVKEINDLSLEYRMEVGDIDLVREDYRTGMADKWIQDVVDTGQVDYSKVKKPLEGGYGDVSTKKGTVKGKTVVDAKNTYYNKDSMLADVDKLITNESGYQQLGSRGKTVKKFRPSIKDVPVDEAKVGPARLLRNQAERAEVLDEVLQKQIADKQEVYQFFEEVLVPNSPAYNKISEDLAPFVTRGSGSYDFTISGNKSGTLLDAIQNANLKYTSDTAQTLSPSFDRMLDLDNPQPGIVSKAILKMNEASVHTFSRASKALRSVNNYGKLADDLLEDARTKSISQTANALHEFKSERAKLGIARGSQEELQATEILRGTRPITQASKAAVELSRGLTRRFERVVKDAVEAGSMDSQRGAKLLSNLRTKGYFPRVYNWDYLETRAGKEAWVNALTKVGFGDEASALNAVKSLTKDVDIPHGIVSKPGPDGKVEYYLDPFLADKLWRGRGVSLQGTRSTHFAERRIHEKFEKALDQFLVKDPEAILTKYYQDVYRDIEYKKAFGAGDERAIQIEKEIAKDSPDLANAFRETFLMAAGDPKSKRIDQFINAPQVIKDTLSGARALENFKLVHAQIMNMGQWTNTATEIFGKSALPLSSRVRAVKNGVVNSLKMIPDRERRATAERFGAALQAAEMQATSHLREGILSRGAESVLRYTGFFKADTFSRYVSFEFGRALTEETLQRKANLLAKNLPDAHPQMKEVNKLLMELGFDPKINPTEVALADIHNASLAFDNALQRKTGEAALRVANRSNFVSDPATSPMLANTFWGKMFYQFKSFQIGQTGFLIDNVLKPAKRGNFAPLASLMSFQAGVGMGLDEVRRFIIGDDADYTLTERYIRGVGSIGGFTIMYDIAQAASRNATGLISFAAGPSATKISNLGWAASQTAGNLKAGKEDAFKPMKKAVIQEIVFPGKKQIMEDMKSKPLFEATLD